MYFKHAHRVQTQQNIELMAFALTCVRIFLLDAWWPPTFFWQITSFSDSFRYTEKQKNLYVGSFLIIYQYTLQIGSNWYMDRGVHDLEFAPFKANPTWFNDM